MKRSLKPMEYLLAGHLILIMALCASSLLDMWAIAYLAGFFYVSAWIGYVSWLTKNAFASYRWPTTPSGRVGASVVTKYETNSDGNESASYSLSVSYEYSVEGTTYRGTRYRFPFAIGVSKRAFKDTAQGLRGKVGLPIYYNPAVPSLCTLKRGVSLLDAIALLAFYFASIPLLLAIGYFGLRSFR